MSRSQVRMSIFIEAGSKRTFAGGIDWPGWCRSGRDEAAALEALRAYAPRYARALRGTRLGFEPPRPDATFAVAERLPGNATTDFGAPEARLSGDARPFKEEDRRRAETLLKACWRAFDTAAESARGKALRKGPRGGGRALAALIDHVREAQAAYLRSLGWKPGSIKASPGRSLLDEGRREVLEALAFAVANELPDKGPRGGARWKPRTFVRRVAWHILDHAWEIEDRKP